MPAGFDKRTRVAAAVAGALFALAAGHAFGAAFSLQENSGSGLGNAFAGGAAAAEDASTLWANPAGMARLVAPEVAAAVHFVTPSFKFRDEGSLPAFSQTLGGTGGDAGSLNIIPNLYAVVPIDRQWSVGVGVNAPFGLVTEYDDTWLGRFQAVKSEIMTINVNPSLSWRVNDAFAVGVGVNWQRVDAELTSKINYSAALAQAAGQAAAGGLIPPGVAATIVGLTPGLESKAKVEGDDSAWGWNIGFLWNVTPQTRIGGSYRSTIKYHVSGTASFDFPALPTVPPALAPVLGVLAGGVNSSICTGSVSPPAPDCRSIGVTADIKLPDLANLSVFHRLNDRWDLMADVQYTGWSTFKELKFVRSTGTVLSTTPENFDDVWRVSAGATYHHSDAWSFRGGLAWDQTPASTADRTPRLPDESRLWLSAGAQYRFSKNLKLDGGFTYIIVDDADLNQNEGSTAASGLIKGHYDSNVTIFSAQLTYTF
ncbi:MAG TPA: outer membrane protein transport protein [Casimicrobiaceae bacterium]